MSVSAPFATRKGAPSEAVSHWKVVAHETVGSTQDIARALPPWSVVTATRQVRGRGQAGRSFASNEGGIYLSAVLPFEGDVRRWTGLALAVGWAIRETLREVGFGQIRLRWPNDLMIDSVKVGGILLEQGAPRSMLVGIGINVTNRPWSDDPGLLGIAGRLVDFASQPPEPERLVALILRAVRGAYRLVDRRGFAKLVPAINRSWGPKRRQVVLTVATGLVAGRFLGIDEEGSLLLEQDDGRLSCWSHSRVTRVSELE